MKFFHLICAGLAVLIALIACQVSYAAQETTVTLTFDRDQFLFDQIAGYDRIRLKDGSILSHPGEPALPALQIRIAIPSGTRATDIKVRPVYSHEIAGTYRIYPGQQPARLDGSPPPPFAEPDPKVYGSTDPYPAPLANLTGQTDLAGQQMAVVTVYPMQYIPASGQLILHQELEITVSSELGYTSLESYAKFTEKHREHYQNMVRSMVVNPEDVFLDPAPAAPSKSLPSGDFDHVIITSNSYSSYFDDLVQWHNKRGLRDTVVTTSYIYSNYSGSNDQQRIRNFIIDARSTWGTMYFLMGGEDGTVPFKYQTYYDESTPSDNYYADYDDDWTWEVYVGRLSADSLAQFSRAIDKIINYEKNPPTSGFAKDVLLIGMDLTISPDPVTPAEDLKETIDGYIPTGFNVTKVYDSHGGNHETNTISALNAGQNLVNHADHSNSNILGLGYLNHSGAWYLVNSDVDALTNNNQPCNLITMGCWANDMTYEDGIGEHFVIYNDSRAGVSYTGNTRSGWFFVGYTEYLSCQLDRDWWRGLFNYDQYVVGHTLAWAKHQFDEYGTPYPEVWSHCEWTLNLLGDPAMPLWTDNPASLTVTHPSSLPTGSSSFLVHVESGGSNLASAYVCLWKEGEVYLTGSTNSSGNVTFNPSPGTTGTMYVTVTKHNYLPYEGSATVTTGGSDPSITVTYPNGGETLSESATITWTATDPDPGETALLEIDLEYSANGGGSWLPIASDESNDGSYLWDVSGLSDGSNYLVRATATDTTGRDDSDVSDATFTIDNPDDPSITVTYPNGGETLSGSATITWTATDPDPGQTDLLTVVLDYSSNGGGAWSLIDTCWTNDGSYLWDVSGLPDGSDYLVRATAIDPTMRSNSDQSDATFTIENPDDPTITVTYPNGGETLSDSATITWTASDPDPGETALLDIDLEYSNNGGSSWLPIATGETNDGSYLWDVSGLADGPNYLVRATATDPTMRSDVDVSDAVFTIDNPDDPSITVTYPNGGETLSGSATITWTATDTDPGETALLDIDLEYSSNDGGNWNPIVSGETNDGAYDWDVSGLADGPNYLVRVTATDTTARSDVDQSDATFTIDNPDDPSITVTYPNGGETLSGSATITWIATDPDPGETALLDIDLEYSSNGGGSWTPIASNESNDGSYFWDVSGLSDGSNYLVRATATDTTGQDDSDQSDAIFTIDNPDDPSITVTYPNGGETLSLSATITWTATDPDPGETELLVVVLDYSSNGGGSWSLIDTCWTNDGAHLWDISGLPDGSNYLVRATTIDPTMRSDEDESDATFSIDNPGVPDITVTYPNGGETLSGSATITWTATDPDPGETALLDIDLEYSANGGGSWNSITSGEPNDGSYPWDISGLSDGSNYLVRATATDPTMRSDTDQSDATFTIDNPDDPSITVTYPNGGETLSESATITWTATDPDPGETALLDIDLEYSANGGGSWNPIASGEANDGAYLWDVSGLSDGSNYLVRATATDTTGRDDTDQSNSTFTIDNPDDPSITVTYPNGGETLSLSATITWTAADPDPGETELLVVVLDYSSNGGGSWSLIDTCWTNDGAHLWDISGLPDGSNYLVRATAIDPTMRSDVDVSDAAFTIDNPDDPSITVTYPNGGETLSESATITWTATDPDPGETALLDIDLEYSANGGGSWNPIASGEANDGSYLWDVSGLSDGSNYLVRATATDPTMRSDTDQSDATFSIDNPGVPDITVTYPNGGETLSESATITWTATDPDPGETTLLDIDLEYSANGGGSWNPIASGEVNDGSYLWDVSGLLDGSNYLVRATATDTTGRDDSDQSDAVFTIDNPDDPSITVTYPNGGETLSESATITWTATDPDPGETALLEIDLEYSANGGGSWNPIASGEANDGAYLWDVSGLSDGSNYLVRATATDTTGRDDSDQSDAVFTIDNPDDPSITVTYPNGGETFSLSATITWTATDPDPGQTELLIVALDYSSNGGNSWSLIDTCWTNDGTYLWDVSGLPDGSDYLVRASAIDPTMRSDSDQSDATFTIENFHPPAPAAISDLEATLADSTIYLSWSAVAVDSVGNPIVVDHYVIYRNADPDFDPAWTDSVGSTTNPFYEDPTPALKNTAENHYYVAKAVDSFGRKSSNSNKVGEFDRALVNEPPVAK